MLEGECTWEFLCCRLISEGLWPKSWPRQFLLNESMIKTVMKQIWLRRSLLSPAPTSNWLTHLPSSSSLLFQQLEDTGCAPWTVPAKITDGQLVTKFKGRSPHLSSLDLWTAFATWDSPAFLYLQAQTDCSLHPAGKCFSLISQPGCLEFVPCCRITQQVFDSQSTFSLTSGPLLFHKTLWRDILHCWRRTSGKIFSCKKP